MAAAVHGETTGTGEGIEVQGDEMMIGHQDAIETSSMIEGGVEAEAEEVEGLVMIVLVETTGMNLLSKQELSVEEGAKVHLRRSGNLPQT